MNRKKRDGASFAPHEFIVNGERLAFSPLPLGTLQMVTELTKELGLDTKHFKSNSLYEIMLAAKEQTERVRIIVALFVTRGMATADSVKQNYVSLLRCQPEELATLLAAGIIANGQWIDLTGAQTAKVDFSIISEEEYFTKPFVELIKEIKPCHQ